MDATLAGKAYADLFRARIAGADRVRPPGGLFQKIHRVRCARERRGVGKRSGAVEELAGGSVCDHQRRRFGVQVRRRSDDEFVAPLLGGLGVVDDLEHQLEQGFKVSSLDDFLIRQRANVGNSGASTCTGTNTTTAFARTQSAHFDRLSKSSAEVRYRSKRVGRAEPFVLSLALILGPVTRGAA